MKTTVGDPVSMRMKLPNKYNIWVCERYINEKRLYKLLEKSYDRNTWIKYVNNNIIESNLGYQSITSD